MRERVVLYLERRLIRQISLAVTKIVTKILSAFGRWGSRGEGIHKVLSLASGHLHLAAQPTVFLCRIYPLLCLQSCLRVREGEGGKIKRSLVHL